VFGTARLGSRNEKPLTRYCRDNVAQAVIGALPEWRVVGGEIVVVVG